MCEYCKKDLVFAYRDIKGILDKLRFLRGKLGLLTEADRSALLEGLVADVDKIDRVETQEAA